MARRLPYVRDMPRSGSRVASPALLRKLQGQRTPVSRSIHGASSSDPKEASCYAALRALEFDEPNAETRALRVMYELRRDIDGITRYHDDVFAALAKRFMVQELPESEYTDRFLGYAFNFGCRMQAEAAVRGGEVFRRALDSVETQMSLETITLKAPPTPEEMKKLVLPAAFRQLIDLLVAEIMADDPKRTVDEWISTSMLRDIMLIGLSELTEPRELSLKAAFRKIDWRAPLVPSRQSLMLGEFGACVVARTLPTALELVDSALEEKRAPAPWTKQGLRKFRSKLKVEYRSMGRRVV